MTSLAPVPSESTTCANCSAPLVADQRYCLSCGQPCSPVRLAFLDVLESERQPQMAPGALPITYAANLDATAGPAWLRRAAPFLAVASVLLLAMIVGLLVGHWVTQSKAPSAPQVIKVEGLAGAPAATAAAPTSTTAASAAKPSAASAKSEESAELAEAKKEEEQEAKEAVKAPPAKKLSTSDVNKLTQSTGKKHEQELNKLTTAPIEVK